MSQVRARAIAWVTVAFCWRDGRYQAGAAGAVGRRAAQVRELGQAPQHRTGPGPAGADRAGLRAGRQQPCGGGAAGRQPQHGQQLRIWRAFGLQPWRTETFKVSPDPLLIDKIRDVVGLYLAPPANAAVFSVDEKPHIQALQRTAPVLPMMPGVPERRSFDYVRHGTTDLLAALNIATGKVIGKLSAQHRAVDFRDFPGEIDRQAGPALAVHVICD